MTDGHSFTLTPQSSFYLVYLASALLALLLESLWSFCLISSLMFWIYDSNYRPNFISERLANSVLQRYCLKNDLISYYCSLRIFIITFLRRTRISFLYSFRLETSPTYQGCFLTPFKSILVLGLGSKRRWRRSK